MADIKIRGHEFSNAHSVRISDINTPTITHQFDDTTISSVSAPTSGEILAGKYAWVNGTTVTGSMYNHSNNNIRLTSTATVSISEGYYNGNGNVGIDLLELNKIIPENIKSGVTILGVPGNYSGGSTPSYTVTTASEGHVLSGLSFYKATSTTTATLTTGSLYNGDGYLMGTTTGDTISLDTSNHRVKLLPLNDMFIGGSGDMGNGLHTTYSDLAVAINLISSTTETTSSKISTGNTILGITGTGGGGSSITTLQNTSWCFKLEPNIYSSTIDLGNFTDGTGSYWKDIYWNNGDLYFSNPNTSTKVYNGSTDTWDNQLQRIINITGTGSSSSSSSVISWFESNAGLIPN